MLKTSSRLTNICWEARRIEKTCGIVKKLKLYSMKLIRLFVPSKYYKSIGIDLLRQTNTSIPQVTGEHSCTT